MDKSNCDTKQQQCPILHARELQSTRSVAQKDTDGKHLTPPLTSLNLKLSEGRHSTVHFPAMTRTPKTPLTSANDGTYHTKSHKATKRSLSARFFA